MPKHSEIEGIDATCAKITSVAAAGGQRPSKLCQTTFHRLNLWTAIPLFLRITVIFSSLNNYRPIWPSTPSLSVKRKKLMQILKRDLGWNETQTELQINVKGQVHRANFFHLESVLWFCIFPSMKQFLFSVLSSLCLYLSTPDVHCDAVVCQQEGPGVKNSLHNVQALNCANSILKLQHLEAQLLNWSVLVKLSKLEFLLSRRYSPVVVVQPVWCL